MLLAEVSCLLFIPFALASLVNVTIDDNFGDPQTGTQITYVPSGSWNDGMQPCSGCITQLDPSQLYNGTLHNSIFDPKASNTSGQTPTASVTFNGSAVYVYCAIAHSSGPPNGNSDMTFFIDGEIVGTFVQAPTPGSLPGYQYHVPVYANHSMPATHHTFTLQNGHTGGQGSLVLLDSIMYTHDDGKLESTSASVSAAHLRRTVLLGSILGSVLGLFFVGIGIYLFIRRLRRCQWQHLPPSQQYASHEFTTKWFDEGRAFPDLQSPICNIFDLTPEMTSVQLPQPAKIMQSIPETCQESFAHDSSSETLRSRTRADAASAVSTSYPTTSRRELPLIPGRRNFRVVNR